MTDLSLSAIIGASYRVLTTLPRLNALRTRSALFITAARPLLAAFQADPKLFDDWEAYAAQVSPDNFSVQAGYSATWVQKSLNEVLGADLAVDGDIMGPKSQAAIREFQQKNPPLKVDGWAGIQTCAVLDAAVQKLEAAQR